MSHFFAYLARLKHIRRWGLMRNTQPENTLEHTAQTAMIAHALALEVNARSGAALDANRVAVLALFHDVGEVITGDLATPIKYFNPDIKAAYKRIEQVAAEKLLAMAPAPHRGEYEPLLLEQADSLTLRVVKAADKIAAYCKCLEELKAGNQEFALAAQSILAGIHAMELPEAEWFLRTYGPSFSLTLDELN